MNAAIVKAKYFLISDLEESMSGNIVKKRLMGRSMIKNKTLLKKFKS